MTQQNDTQVKQNAPVAGSTVGKLSITKADPASSNWVEGHITRSPKYTFEAKVFDVGSEYGIDRGRVSKLNVYHKGTMIIEYDRGSWDRKPLSWKEKAVLKDIVASFPELKNGIEGLAAKSKIGFRFGRGGL